MSKKLIAINNMKKLAPWVRYLDEVGPPFRLAAEELDARLVELRSEHTCLVRERQEFEAEIRKLWKPSEIKAAVKLATDLP